MMKYFHNFISFFFNLQSFEKQLFNIIKLLNYQYYRFM